ncbi:hypothetical protein LIER_20117 [Lithospermum erythrorhizon]|uniref:Uncharacterized protein n=1 Tax=Lithospermum erythrorhizon TaxID=34254 RepID=A0AAV3QMW6_LITER
MGTEILRPQDCLAEILRISPASFHHRRKHYPTTRNNRKPAEVRTIQNKRPHHHQQMTNPKRFDFRAISKHTKNSNNNDFSMRKVTILRRGQSFDSLNKNTMYAGSAFSVSPPPSDLPLPTFSKKLSFDDHATRDLRRLLRLE